MTMGELLPQANAEPPSHPLLISGSRRGLSFFEQVNTGAETGAFSSHAQEGLQQSQYRVVRPLPEAAWATIGLAAASRNLINDRGLITRKVTDGVFVSHDFNVL